MASVKIVLRKKKNKDGTFPLALRITQNRKTSYLYLQKNINEKDWDSIHSKIKKSYPTSSRLNNYLMKKLSDANNALIDLEMKHKDISLDMIREEIDSKKPRATFFGQVEVYLETLQASGNYNRVSAETPVFNLFRTFLKGKDPDFQDISISLLERYRAFLRGSGTRGERTIANHLLLIRAIFNRAIKDGLVDSRYYPFGNNKFVVKKPESLKIGLDAEELASFAAVKLDKESYAHHARNIWLFSFYLAGMRASDVLQLRWSDIKNDRLYYVMGKNQKPGSLKIPEQALSILKDYQHLKKDEKSLVFPDLDTLEDFNDKERIQRRIHYILKKINGRLKKIAQEAGISKSVTMHIARHTFAGLAGEKIPIQMLQKLYRHSNVTTTIGYQKSFIIKDADDALEAVLNG